MRNFIAVQKGQDHGHGDAVIPAQGSVLGVQVIALQGQIQPLPIHILGTARRLFAHHVQVPLEDHGLRRLIAGRGLFENDHIPRLIPAAVKAPLPGKGHAPVRRLFRAAGAMGDGAQLLKKTKNLFGL